MNELGPIELARKKLEMQTRAESNWLRFEWLNKVLPARLAEFDRRLNAGKPYELEGATAEELIEEALKAVAT